MTDSGDTSLTELLEEVMAGVGEELHAGFPGVVTRVESTDPPVLTVAPLIHRHGTTEKDQPIPGVPVKTMAGGGAVVSLPTPQVGDLVWLSAADRELDTWIAGGGAKDARASVPRAHNRADVVAEPMTIASLPLGASGNFWLGGSSVTSILEGLAVKLGALAIDYATKGTTLNSQLTVLLTAINAYVVLVGAAMQAMGLSWLDVAPLLAGDAQVRALAAGAACTAAGATPAGLVTAAITLFNAPPATALRTSTKVKVE